MYAIKDSVPIATRYQTIIGGRFPIQINRLVRKQPVAIFKEYLFISFPRQIWITYFSGTSGYSDL